MPASGAATPGTAHVCSTVLSAPQRDPLRAGPRTVAVVLDRALPTADVGYPALLRGSRTRRTYAPTVSARLWMVVRCGEEVARVVAVPTRQVLLVEDEPLLASLMGQVLTDSGLVVRVCTSETEARRTLRDFDPDAALIDVHLGSGPSGLYLAHSLSRSHPHVGILLLSRYEDLSAAGLDAWELPEGSAFLRKDQVSDREVLLAAIDGVLRGRPVLVPARAVVDGGEDGTGSAGQGALAGLTRSQLAVLRLAALGLTNTAIAARRETSERSVERLLRSVYTALGIAVDSDLNPRVEAVRRYVAAAGLPVERGGVPRRSSRGPSAGRSRPCSARSS